MSKDEWSSFKEPLMVMGLILLYLVGFVLILYVARMLLGGC